jgi:mRNA-degrading endonuclease RelE of RelBE toxin-antitoxin system
MYNIEYTEKAIVDLHWFKKHEQNIIIDNIDQRLRHEPTKANRNRKPLRQNAIAAWELRVGDFRVLYDVDVQVSIVAIKRIGEKQGNTLYFRGQKEEL